MLSSLFQVRSRSNASLTAATGGSQTLLIGRNTPTSTPATSPITARYIYIISTIYPIINTISTLITGAGLRQVLHPPQQPEEAHEGARQGRGLVLGGQQWGEVSTVQYSTVQYGTVQYSTVRYSTATGRGEYSTVQTLL